MTSEQNSRNTLRAFLTALANQQRPCPPELITDLHNLGQQLHSDADLLPEPDLLLQPILDRHPNLNKSYLAAGLQIHQQQKETVKKDGPTAFGDISIDGLINTVKVVCTDTDPIAAAQKTQSPAPRPFQKIKQLLGLGSNTN